MATCTASYKLVQISKLSSLNLTHAYVYYLDGKVSEIEILTAEIYFYYFYNCNCTNPLRTDCVFTKLHVKKALPRTAAQPDITMTCR